MRMFNVVVERDPETGLFVGSVPGWPGMLLEDGDPKLESEFVGLQTIQVA